MRTPARIWSVVGFLILLHFGLHLSLGLGESAPDLLVVALLIGAREVNIGRGAGLGFLLGLSTGLTSDGPVSVGTATLPYGRVGG